MLEDLGAWIEVECPSELFEGKAMQVQGFMVVRKESLKEVRKELARREKWGEFGEEKGYTGDWEVIKKDERCDSGGTDNGDVKAIPGYTNAAFEEAAQAGRKAAEEAKLMDGWDADF